MKRMGHVLTVFSTFLFLSFTSISFVHATVIFSNYGDSFSHSVTGGWAVAHDYQIPGGSYIDDWDMAMQFNALDQDYLLESIYITVGLISGPNELDVWLMSDDNNKPGTALESFHLSNEMPVHSWTQHSPILINASQSTILEANESYWLALSVSGSDNDVNWYMNDIGQVGPRAIGVGGEWIIAEEITPAVFQIDGASVPEPATILLLASGLLGLVGLRKKFKG